MYIIVSWYLEAKIDMKLKVFPHVITRFSKPLYVLVAIMKTTIIFIFHTQI